MTTFSLTQDLPDERDYQFVAPGMEVALPFSISLYEDSESFPPIYNPDQLNSCTANAIAAVLYYKIIP